MGMKLRFDQRAEADIREIRDYIVQNGTVESANRVRDHLKARARALKGSPLLGKKLGGSEIRALFPTKYPYRIYYTIQHETVVILHIRHTSRNAPKDMN